MSASYVILPLPPCNLIMFHLDAAVLFLGSQVTYILRFTLSKNIRIARKYVWDQTVASRGKGQDFWQPYVEEWKVPPVVDVDSKSKRFVNKLLGGSFMFIIKRSKPIAVIYPS